MLVALKIIPDIGPMKKAELATQAGTPIDCELAADAKNIVQGSHGQHHAQHEMPHHTSDEYAVQAIEQEFEHSDKQGQLHNFVVPMLALIAFTIYFDIDVLKGVIATLLLIIPYYYFQKLMTISEMMEVMMNGFKTMLPAISTVIAAFIFKDVCDKTVVSLANSHEQFQRDAEVLDGTSWFEVNLRDEFRQLCREIWICVVSQTLCKTKESKKQQGQHNESISTGSSLRFSHCFRLFYHPRLCRQY